MVYVSCTRLLTLQALSKLPPPIAKCNEIITVAQLTGLLKWRRCGNCLHISRKWEYSPWNSAACVLRSDGNSDLLNCSKNRTYKSTGATHLCIRIYFFFLLKISVSDIEPLTLLWLKINEHDIDTDVHAIHWNKAFVSCRCVCVCVCSNDGLIGWLISLGEIDCTRYCQRDFVDASSAVYDADGQRCTFLWHSFGFSFIRLLDVDQRSCVTLLSRAAHK